MKILHYGLGYPPERSGGLVKYVMDLMEEQVKQGHNVSYLYPGTISIFKPKTRIKEEKERIISVRSFNLVDSLPLAVFGGIKDPKPFMRRVDCKIFQELFEQVEPDVIHVHTLMGIPKEFFEVANHSGIRIVFTSHDYFGISPNPTFYFNGKSWHDENSLNYWLNVSKGASSVKKLRVLQISFYPKIRDFIKKFKKQSFQKEQNYQLLSNNDFDPGMMNDFRELQIYYQDIFKKINFFHFNSLTSRDTFLKNIDIEAQNFVVKNITNKDISPGEKTVCIDFRNIKKISYIGQYANFKGFDTFVSLAEAFRDEDIAFEIYGENINIELPDNIVNKGKFSNQQRNEVFNSLELLIIPSNWRETFGFLTLEAISYNVPVIVSSNVGSKDLLPRNLITDNEKLIDYISNSRKLYQSVRFNIELNSFENHVKEIIEYYEEKNDKDN